MNDRPVAVDVCYVLKDGFPARMILHSEILPQLRAKGLSVALIVPNPDEPIMQEMSARYNLTLFQAPEIASRLTTEYEWLIRRYLFEDVLANPTLRSWHLKLKDAPEKRVRNRVRAAFYLAINRLSQRSRRFRSFLKQIEKRLFLDNAEVRELLASINPGLLVSTYPVSMIEAAFLHEARNAGIATVSQLLSWDNITSKGHFSVVSDDFVSWGPIMTAELEEYYQVPRSRIHECGVAHFDRHITAVVKGRDEAILSGIGLDPDRPYLFFGMSSHVISPNEIEVVEWLANEVRRGTFGPDVQLIIRPHPQNLQRYTSDESWLLRLQALGGGPVAVDYPELEQSAMAWNMKEDDLPRLVNLLAGCRLVLNSGSTLAIDGIIHDKPVVLTLFDGDQELPWHWSIRRYLDVIHMRKLIALKGLRVACSYDELKQHVAEYLEDPTLDAAGRALTRQQECGVVDGNACKRIAQAIADLVDRRRQVATSQSISVNG